MTLKNIFKKIGVFFGYRRPERGKTHDCASNSCSSYENHESPACDELRKIKREIFNVEMQIFSIECRKSGRSTRILDETIQKLFEHPDRWIEFRDHHGTLKSTRFHLERLKNRLMYEHHLNLSVKSGEDDFVWIRLSGYEKPDMTNYLTPWREKLYNLNAQRWKLEKEINKEEKPEKR